jgi:hypothetical protein
MTSDSDRSGVDPDHWQRNDYLPDDDTSHLPRRPQQAPPADVVQQQLRLLVQAVHALESAVYRTDRKHLSGGSSVAPTTARARELADQVAELGGWAGSLLEPGTHVVDGHDEYVVGEQES